MGVNEAAEVQRVTLEFGCGHRKRPGAIGVDWNPDSDANVVCNLNRLPWCFKDNVCDELICNHIIEHLSDTFAVMAEIHRICRPGAIVRIRCPHFTCLYSYRNPTHLHHFSLDSFDYFLTDSKHVEYPVRTRFRLIKKQFEFSRALVSWPAKIFAKHFPHQYEKHLCFISPCLHIYVELEVVKDL